jgi:predicted Fe-Mo cluster-binding NifX family protein
MRLCITAQGPEGDSPVDSRFGRAKLFRVVDTDSGRTDVIDNVQNLQAAQGAGIQSARRCVQLGVQAVITGNVGPKAFSVLQAEGVAVYTGAAGTVDQALVQFGQGKLTQADGATVSGHWT